MKKLIALLTAATMTCSMTMTVLASTFTDVTPDSAYSWAYESVEDLVAKKIIAADTLYNPAQTLNNQHILAFMGRVLGINEEENAKAVSFALSKYDSFLSNYDTYAKKEAAFLMYKGLFTQAEIKTMLDNKDTSVTRYQAAIYITKLMGGEEEVKNKVLVSLDYADTKDIPTAAQGYVEYMKDKGIMLGDNENKFSPNVTLNRAMMAVMLSKIYTSMNRNYTTGQIAGTTPSTNTVVTLDSAGLKVQNALTADTKILLDGEKKSVSDLKVGQTITFTKSNGKIVEADVISSSNDSAATYEGVYTGKYEKSGKTYIKISKDDSVTSTYNAYPLSSDVEVTYNGKSSTFSKIATYDSLSVELLNGEIITINATSKKTQIDNATVTALSYNDSTITISSSDAAYDGKTYKVDGETVVSKNGKFSDMASVAVGDTVSLTLTYQTVTQVTAYSKSGDVEGTIKSLTISSTPSMVLTVNGSEQTYTIASGVKVTSGDTASDLYSLRVGYLVTATLEGQTITKINIESESSNRMVEGIIQMVNPTYKYIKITNSATGATEDIFVSSLTKIMDSSLQKSYTLSELKIGDHIVINGNYKSGGYEASSIIVMN